MNLEGGGCAPLAAYAAPDVGQTTPALMPLDIESTAGGGA